MLYDHAQLKAHLFMLGIVGLVGMVGLAFVGAGLTPLVVSGMSHELAFIVAGMIGAAFCAFGVVVGLFFGGIEL